MLNSKLNSSVDRQLLVGANFVQLPNFRFIQDVEDSRSVVSVRLPPQLVEQLSVLEFRSSNEVENITAHSCEYSPVHCVDEAESILLI